MEVVTYWALLFTCAHLIFNIEACGIITHITLGQRASENFEGKSGDIDYRKLIREHQDAFQPGNVFPDTFYNGMCRGGEFHSVSEDTHWTPFANATVNYIRRKYPQPWTKDAERLVTFLFGIISHSVSDASWHSLGIDQGFLRAMGHVNFHGSYGDAHTTGDFGGDVVNAVEIDTDEVSILGNWFIPTADLVEIYRDYYGYYKMDAATIDDCAIWMFLGRAGENINVIDALYGRFSRKSPFLVDRMQDYFLGGMDDMAAWTTNSWRNIIHMLDHGTESCKLDDNPLHVRCGDELLSKSLRERGGKRVQVGTNREDYLNKMVHQLHLDTSYVITERTETGIYIKATDKLKALVSRRVEAAMSASNDVSEEEEMTESTQNLITPDVYYDTTNRYSRLGRSLASADVNNDGFNDLIIGSPGHGVDGNQLQGRVYIVYGGEDGLPRTNLTLDTDADEILNGIKKDGMFGHAVAVADLNADDINDLVISAPSVGAGDLTYNGEVYVFYGKKEGTFSTNPDLTIKCKQEFCNLGWSLASADVTGDGFDDVIIGSPFAPAGGEQNGFAGAIFAKKARNESVIYDEDLDWTSKGDRPYSWYGYDVGASPSNVVIGAPARKQCERADCIDNEKDKQAAGKVSIFQTPLTPGTSEWRIFESTTENDYMGSRVVMGEFAGKKNVLNFALPTKGRLRLTVQVGASRMYEVSDSSGVTKIVEYKGTKNYARFGAASWFEDVNGDGMGDVVIGSPHWTEARFFRSGAMQGRVFAFDGHKASGTIKNPDWVLSYEENKSKFGSTIISVKHSKSVDIVVAAPGSNAGAKLGGRLIIFSGL